MKKVLLGVTGSIAAYKAAELVRLMVRRGWEVRVVMTAAAQEFVGPLTFRTLSRNPVATTMFPQPPPDEVPHISLADWADVVVVAPCTANVLAKMAHGLADDLLSATLLSAAGPVVVAPAMNVRMWEHAATLANLDTLRGRCIRIVDVEEGDLACGTTGRGRMAPPEAVLAALEAL